MSLGVNPSSETFDLDFYPSIVYLSIRGNTSSDHDQIVGLNSINTSGGNGGWFQLSQRGNYDLTSSGKSFVIQRKSGVYSNYVYWIAIE